MPPPPPPPPTTTTTLLPPWSTLLPLLLLAPFSTALAISEQIFADTVKGLAANTCTTTPSCPPVELGQVFQVDSAGNLSHVRHYAVATERGPHTARIWRESDGVKLAEMIIPATEYTGSERWVTAALPTPLAVTAGTQYQLSVSSGSDIKHGFSTGTYGEAGRDGHLIWPASGARFTFAMGSKPSQTPAGGETYYRDLIFEPVQQVPTSLEVVGTASVVIPLRRHTDRGFFAVKAVLDQSGDPIDGAATPPVTWSLAAPTIGASINSAGELIVTSDTTVDKVMVVATSATGLTGRVSMDVEARSMRVSVAGPAAISLSSDRTADPHVYSAIASDQRGAVTLDAVVAWSVVPPVPGVTISQAGALEIVSSIATVCSFSVIATVPASNGVSAVNGSQRVQLSNFSTAAFLQTDDTAVSIVVQANRIFLYSMKHRHQGWEWLPAPSEVPLASPVGGASWTFVGSNETDTQLSLTFRTSSLEMRSIWIARHGPGPVENWVEVAAVAAGTAMPTFGPALLSANVSLRAPVGTIFHRFSKTSVGMPTDDSVTLTPSISVPTSSNDDAYVPTPLNNLLSYTASVAVIRWRDLFVRAGTDWLSCGQWNARRSGAWCLRRLRVGAGAV